MSIFSFKGCVLGVTFDDFTAAQPVFYLLQPATKKKSRKKLAATSPKSSRFTQAEQFSFVLPYAVSLMELW